MLTLRTNTLNISLRILALFIIIAIHYLIIKNGIIEGRANHEKATGILYVILPLLTYVFVGTTSTFLQVLKVEVDIFTGQITLVNPLSPPIVISKQDIIGYFTTIYKGSRAKPWNGLLIKTKSNKSYRLTEQNLKSVPELKEYFEQENLKYLGEKQPFFFLNDRKQNI